MRSKNKRPRLRRVVPVSRRQRWTRVLATDEDYESLVRTAAAARAALAELVPPDEPYPISRHLRW